MKKLKIRVLFIELGRQCNLRCKHCLAGEPQNLSITEDIVDNLLDNVYEVTKLYFTGGEPTLYVDKMIMIMNKIKEHGVKIDYLRVITNGKEKNTDFVDFINNNEEYFKNGVKIKFSTDKYHTSCDAHFTKDDLEKNIKWYKDKLHSNVEYNINPFPDISLLYEGRAKNLSEDELSKFLQIQEYICEKNKGYMVKIEDDYLPNFLYICSNGNICNVTDLSYERTDNFSMGNILKSDLFTMICKWNDECKLNDNKDIKRVIKDYIPHSQVIILYEQIEKISEFLPIFTKQRDKENINNIEKTFYYFKENWNKHIKDDLIKNEQLSNCVSELDKYLSLIENALQESKRIIDNDILYLLYVLFG